jgi:hypothetical protein
MLQRAGPAKGSPDELGRSPEPKGRKGEREFIFSCLECASQPYLDIRRQSELEAAGWGEERAPSPSQSSLTTALPCLLHYHPFWGLPEALNSSPCRRGRCPIIAD